MDSSTNTDNVSSELKGHQENILLEIVKDLCSNSNELSANLRGKVSRAIADCDLSHCSSLHKTNSADEATSTLLGFLNQTAAELSFYEQAELNQAIITKIEAKLPTFTTELKQLQNMRVKKKDSAKYMKELQDSLDHKLTTLEDQESEKAALMLEWLEHRLHEAGRHTYHNADLLALKTRILELKSQILHLQLLQSIFTETNQSIAAYSELRRDLQDSINETEHRIQSFRENINGDI